MKITAEPRSDQWNADDFIGGPRTFTVAGVKVGAAEQKYDIELAEGEGRVWRPPLTMLRVLMYAWGDEAADWEGRRVTLYVDPTVRFGAEVRGGIRISHLSHIDKQLSVPISPSRGKRSLFKVAPLVESAPAPAKPTRDFRAEIDLANGDVDALRALWKAASAAGADRGTLDAIAAAASAATPQADVQ